MNVELLLQKLLKTILLLSTQKFCVNSLIKLTLE
jgi:hypothetical protein